MTTIQKAAIHIAERAKELCDIQSRAPDSIAGAAIYMSCAAAGERKQMKGKFYLFLIFENRINLLFRCPKCCRSDGKYHSTDL